MPDASADGYWLITSTGDVYAFGDAPYFGAPGHGTVTSAVATPDWEGLLVSCWATVRSSPTVTPPSWARPRRPTSAWLDPAAAIFATSDGRGIGSPRRSARSTTSGTSPDDRRHGRDPPQRIDHRRQRFVRRGKWRRRRCCMPVGAVRRQDCCDQRRPRASDAVREEHAAVVVDPRHRRLRRRRLQGELRDWLKRLADSVEAGTTANDCHCTVTYRGKVAAVRSIQPFRSTAISCGNPSRSAPAACVRLLRE